MRATVMATAMVLYVDSPVLRNRYIKREASLVSSRRTVVVPGRVEMETRGWLVGRCI